jgi:RNA polymerase sigma-70 factor (ECF subfamily)
VSSTSRRQRFEDIADEVFQPLQRYLRRRAGSADAEDVLSEVMVTIWRRLDEVPQGRALPWSYGVARRALANQRRSQSRRLRLVQRMETEPHDRLSPDHAEQGPDADLMAALDALDDRDREILRLWAWEQLEPREIATVLGLTVNAATLRLSRSKKRLSAELSRQVGDDAGHKRVEGTQESR